MRSGSSLVIATPGRLQDFITRRLIDLRDIKILVLDEADRMLDMGFLPAIQPHSGYPAATPANLVLLSHHGAIRRGPGKRRHARPGSHRASVRCLSRSRACRLQAYEVRPAEKPDVLRQLLYAEKGQTLIFARTKRGTERLAKELVREGFSAAMIHGDRSQSQRNGALSGFQDGKFQVLVATDVAARGLHIDDVAHVINYDLPKMAEDFIHRVGRTGRAGSEGLATSLVSGGEVIELRHIERALKLKIERKQIDWANAGRSEHVVENTLASRTLTSLPGEVFA